MEVTNEHSPLMTIGEVAEYFCCCRQHVYQMIEEGLPVVRLGRAVRFRREAVEAFLKSREEIAGSPAGEASDEF